MYLRAVKEAPSTAKKKARVPNYKKKIQNSIEGGEVEACINNAVTLRYVMLCSVCMLCTFDAEHLGDASDTKQIEHVQMLRCEYYVVICTFDAEHLGDASDPQQIQREADSRAV
jgi:hypothetical protein